MGSPGNRYTSRVNRKRMVALAILAVLAVMAVSGVHELFEGADATPKMLDPDYILIGSGAILAFCLGIALFALRSVLSAFFLVLVCTLGSDDSAYSSRNGVLASTVFYSPPPGALALRI